MKKRLTKDFKPSKQSYDNLKKYGAIPEFVDWEFENFFTYFEAAAEAWDEAKENGTETKTLYNKSHKSLWQSALQRWMRESWDQGKGKRAAQWEREREFKCNHRPATKKPQGNLFEELIGCMIAEDLPPPVKRKPNYRLPAQPPIPGSNQSMSFEEAQQALKKMKII